MVEKIKILVIDDEPNVTKAIRRNLATFGYEVIELNNPFKVEDYILYTDIKIVILDLKMPGRNGLEVLRLFRLSCPQIPIIIFTGFEEIDSAIEATKLGAAEYLSKNITPEELRNVLNKYTKVEKCLSSDARKLLAGRLANLQKAKTIEPEKIALLHEIISTDTIPPGFVEIEFEGVIPGEKIPFDLFVQIYNKNDNKHYLRLLCKADTEFTSGLRNMLFNRRLASVYIHEKDYRTFLNYKSRLDNNFVFKNEKIKNEKQLVLYGKAVEAVSEILNQPVENKSVKQAVIVIDDLFKSMVKNPDLFQDMYLLFKHDTSIYNHSANVCLLVTSFGIFLGLNQEYVKILSMGALYHDIGLSKIDKSIFEKQTPLSKSEWAEIKAHPVRGVQMLQPTLIFSPQSLKIVAEHHENSDGSGYPKGLTANQISTLSKFVRIVDKFDSLTTQKPYRAAFTPAQALRKILSEEASPKDKMLIQNFISFLGGRKQTKSTSVVSYTK
ncbi:MAG: response regulator [Deltaproteobacteria bacterium]|nr:response regulator [Deltaproteobacteria bacterium]